MPKLKNSATSAISSASNAALGSSIMVPTEVFKFYFGCGNNFFGDSPRGGVENLEFFFIEHKRNHDLRKNFNAAPLAIDGGFDDRANLHLKYFRIRDGQTATSMAQHRIRFMELFDASNHNFNFHSDFLGQLFLLGPLMRKEFMKRRIDEANGDRQTLHRLEDADEIAALER